MKKIILSLLLSVSLLVACNGDKKRFLNQAKDNMCKVNSMLASPEATADPATQEEIRRLQREIDMFQELSGASKEDFAEELGELTKDCL
ncbi:hypothetical protein K1X76_09580 [bacterium]|nr:hypothetical protein [bacterium]